MCVRACMCVCVCVCVCVNKNVLSARSNFDMRKGQEGGAELGVREGVT